MKFVLFIKKSILLWMSLAAAIYLWFYVLSTALVKVDKAVQIEIMIPKGMAILNYPPKVINYTLRGPRAYLRSELGQKSLKIDLSQHQKQDDKSYLVNTKDLLWKKHSKIEILNISLPSFIVVLDKYAEKVVPIELYIQENTGEHLTFDGQNLTPKEVIVGGARTLVQNINKVQAGPVYISQLDGMGIKELPLILPDERLNLSFKNVKFKYDILKLQSKKILENVPISFLATHMITNVDTRFVQAVIDLSQNIDEKQLRQRLRVVAEVPDDAKGKVQIPLKVQLPEGALRVKLIPDKVNVTVNK